MSILSTSTPIVLAVVLAGCSDMGMMQSSSSPTSTSMGSGPAVEVVCRDGARAATSGGCEMHGGVERVMQK